MVITIFHQIILLALFAVAIGVTWIIGHRKGYKLGVEELSEELAEMIDTGMMVPSEDFPERVEQYYKNKQEKQD